MQLMLEIKGAKEFTLTIILTNKDVEELYHQNALTIKDYVQAVEDAYNQQGLGKAQILPRESFWIPAQESVPVVHKQDGHYRPTSVSGSLKVLACTLPLAGVMGTLSYSGTFPGARARMWLLLYSTEDGDLLALIEANYLIWMATGATAAVAAKYLASRNRNCSVGIIGAGRQAWTQLLGLSSVLHLKGVKVYSRSAERRQDFVRRIQQWVPAQVIAVDSARETIRGADVVVTITTAREPVFAGEWLEAGTHINAIGAHYPDIREVDDQTVRQSAIVVDLRAQSLKEKGDLLIPIRKGIIEAESIRAELGEVVCGKKRGRISDKEVTLFCSGGTAIEYVAAGRLILDGAKDRKFGLKIE